ncbi:cell division protein FtsL [Bacillus benzoevorans]|uniref:Cell division protein FtsL n=1 Tax=Bacillus benzoevorans TaxID=1456 RepID=A0A7X0HMV2_9BACI|nr:cell division protein FtsL [Bacillus benzoevorans]MBB6443738.1 cell division protein FtsL [Bacillus benzoevorans]
MGNLASQLRREQQVEHNQKQKIQVKKRLTEKRGMFTPGEKLLGLIFGAFVCFGSVHIISNQASIYVLNKDIQDTKKVIQEQQRINSDLNIQVSELSQYDRIRAKARELGLELNDQNVKVVQE